MNKEQKLPAQRMGHATTKLQDAMSALKLAVEELHIVDAEMIGSDANRRVMVEASKEDPIKVSDDIESHRMQAAEIASLAAEVAKTACTGCLSLQNIVSRRIGNSPRLRQFGLCLSMTDSAKR